MFEIQKTVEFQGATFTLQCMTGLDMVKLFSGLTIGAEVPPERMVDILERRIVSWEGATNLRGDPMGDFHPDKVEWLDGFVIDFLGAELFKLSQPTIDQKKTSSDSPSSSSTEASSHADGASA